MNPVGEGNNLRAKAGERKRGVRGVSHGLGIHLCIYMKTPEWPCFSHRNSQICSRSLLPPWETCLRISLCEM